MSAHSILIVEDDPIVATDLEETIQSFGYQVVGTAARGERAIALVGEKSPDLVLMDIRIEGEMDGIDAAAVIQQRYGTPVIYLTAHSDTATLERAKVTEPSGYILKPFDEVELRIAIEMAVFRSERQGGRKPVAVEAPAADERLRTLASFHLFRSVPPEPLSRFLSRCKEVVLEPGMTFVREEDDESGGFLVLSGRLCMLKSSPSGRELIVELVCTGDAFGLISGFSPASLTARAQAPSHVLMVPRRAFLALLEELPDLYRVFIEDLARRLREAHDFSRALAHDRVEVRIASALTKLRARIARGEERNRILMTRQELADLTGTTVETAIRVTRSFEKAGVLDLSQPGIMKLIRPDELEGMVG